MGQDFFCIPNGVYAFLHGGTLTGFMPNGVAPYIDCCGVNHNVYHPLFTLIVGFPLQFFPPWTAFGIWAFMHLVVTIILVLFLWKKFRHHTYLYLALSLFLLNSYHYYEIWHAQYHFLFNFFTILFLYESIKNGDTKKAGIFFLLSLLVKPIGLLWVIPLVLYKRFRTVALGLGIYAVVTIIFSLFPFGKYFLQNLFAVSTAIIPTHNLYAIKNIIPSFPVEYIKSLGFLTATGLILLQIIKKPSLFTIITLWIGFQLLFYPMVYHYQYTILAGLICLGILLGEFSPKKKVRWPILFLTLPTPVIFFHLFGDVILPRPHLSVIWLYSAFWLVCLMIYIIVSILRSIKKT